MVCQKIELKALIPASTGLFCHLLVVENTKIIINCGLGSNFDYTVYNSVKEIIQQADCILLTSFSLSCMGAIGLFPNLPVYCSIPTAILGKIMLDEIFHFNKHAILTNFVPKQIKYSQPFKINNLDVISYNAGYIIGNCAFRISKDDQAIVVCYNFNHKKENFLDGLCVSEIENSDFLITNSAYLRAQPSLIKNRDDVITKLVTNHDGTIVIAVSYCRFFELLCILSSYKITIVSKFSKMLVERVKSMVEWCGSKAVDTIPAINIEYCKISELNGNKIIVIVNDEPTCGYLGTVLDKCNVATTIFLNFSGIDFDFCKLPIYNFNYRKLEIKEQQVDKEQENEEKDDEEKNHWSKTHKTFRVCGYLENKDNFPLNKRRKHINEYGEKVTFEFMKKPEGVELKLIKPTITEDLEEMKLIKQGLNPLFITQNMQLNGISDYISAKTVIKGLNPNHIIFIDENITDAMFLAGSLLINQEGCKTAVCTNTIAFTTALDKQKALVDEKITALRLGKLKNSEIVAFRAKIANGNVEYLGECESLAIGNLSQESLKKLLIETGFQVEEADNTLIINENLFVQYLENQISLATSDNALLGSVRDTLYQNICIL